MSDQSFAAKSLCEAIQRTFPIEPVPSLSDAASSSAIDFDVPASLAGKLWIDASPEFLLSHCRDMVFSLTPRGLSYYLPSLMRACLTAYDSMDVLPDQLVSVLSPPDKRSRDRDRWDQSIASLNTGQRTIVAQFLLRLATAHSADYPNGEPAAAISHYWHTYLSGSTSPGATSGDQDAIGPKQ